MNTLKTSKIMYNKKLLFYSKSNKHKTDSKLPIFIEYILWKQDPYDTRAIN